MGESRVSQPALVECSDEELFVLVRVQGADAERRRRAFEELFRRHHPAVFRWCLKILDDADLAEDVTQTVFVALWKESGPYEARSRFKAWLYVVVRNRCFNAARTLRRHRTEALDEELAERLCVEKTPESQLVETQLRSRVADVCAQHLNEREQAVIHLRYQWGLKVKEITERLALTNASGARTYLRSAEEKLRRRLRHVRADWEGSS